MIVNKVNLLSQIWSGSEDFLVREMNAKAKNLFNRAFDNLIERVKSHPISAELNQKQAKDESQFLSVRGNLFSFLGFDASDNPVNDLIEFLHETVRFVPSRKVNRVGGVGRLAAKALYPTREDFDFLSLSWEPGRSWVNALEEGVSNLGYYLFVQSSASRSGKGIQSKYKVRSTEFRPTPYLTPILEQFKAELS